MKHWPNVITALRIAASIGLLFCNVTGWPFWTLYVLCGISDMADGWLARRLHAETKTGATLDSVADIVFVVCCAVQLLPVLEIPTWLWIWSVRFFRGLDFCTPSSLEHYPCFDHYYEESLTY